MKDFKKLEDIVGFVLNKFPKTRDSDRLLEIKVMNFQGLRLTPAQETMYTKVASGSSIRRAARHFRAKGLYMGSPLKTAKRSLYAMAYRKHYKKPTGKYIGGVYVID